MDGACGLVSPPPDSVPGARQDGPFKLAPDVRACLTEKLFKAQASVIFLQIVPQGRRDLVGERSLRQVDQFLQTGNLSLDQDNPSLSQAAESRGGQTLHFRVEISAVIIQ